MNHRRAVMAATLIVVVAWAAQTCVDAAREDGDVVVWQARWHVALWSVVAVAVAAVAIVARRLPASASGSGPGPAPEPARAMSGSTGHEFSALAAGLAHELGQPLSAARVDIEGMHLLRQLGREPTPAHADRVLTRVGTCILAMGQTVEHLRALAHDPTGVVTVTAVDLRDVVEAVLAERERWLPLTGVVIAWDRPAQPVPAYADPEGLRLMLVNLLRNAVEAVAAQDPVRQIVRITAGPGATVAVGDSGPGIPAQELAHIFDPYRTTKGSGRGVGLALVRASAVRMGAQVEVASELGLGATFTVRCQVVPHG